MDHGFKTQNLFLIKEDNANDESDVTKLNNGYVFKNELLDLAIDTSNGNTLDVISIKVGKPFIESDQIFHLLPPAEELVGLSPELEGGDWGCIPRWLIIKNNENYEAYSKQLSEEKFLIPLAMATHGPDPDPGYSYECQTYYIKVDQENLNILNKSIIQFGVNIQGGLDVQDFDIKSKFCTKLKLIGTNSGGPIEIIGQEFSDTDLS